jgi:hypothetical protein
MATNLYWNMAPDNFSVKNFEWNNICTLNLPRGLWAIFGRVDMWNNDSVSQYVKAQLIGGLVVDIPIPWGNDIEIPIGLELLDYVEVYAPEGSSVCLSLMGQVEVDNPDREVSLVCATFDGSALQARVHAIQVDGIEFRPPLSTR